MNQKMRGYIMMNSFMFFQTGKTVILEKFLMIIYENLKLVGMDCQINLL